MNRGEMLAGMLVRAFGYDCLGETEIAAWVVATATRMAFGRAVASLAS